MVAATRRTSILDLLADRASISSGEVADLLGVTRQTAHRHLAGLVRTGDLARTGQGRGTRYVLSPEVSLPPLARWLDELVATEAALRDVRDSVRERLSDREELHAIAWAFDYRLVLVEGKKQRSKEVGPFRPLWETPNGQYPRPFEEVEPDGMALWEKLGRLVTHASLRARLHDLLWEREWSSVPYTHALQAIDAYLELAPTTEDGLDSANALGRARLLARRINDHARLRVAVDAAFRRAEVELSSVDPKPGIVLRLLDVVLHHVDEDANRHLAERLLQQAKRTFQDPWIRDDIIRRQLSIPGSPERKQDLRSQAVDLWLKEASALSGVKRTLFLEEALKRAQRYGLRESAEKIRIEIQENELDRDEMQSISVDMELPHDHIEQTLVWISSGDSWDGCLERLVAFGPLSGHLQHNLEAVRRKAGEFPLLRLMTHRVLGPWNETLFTPSNEEQWNELELSRYEKVGIDMASYVLAEALDRIHASHGPPKRRELQSFFTTCLIDREAAERMAAGVVHYTRRQFDESILVLIPRIEGVIRELVRQLGAPIWREPRPSKERISFGRQISLGDLLRTLGGHLDENWHRYLTTLFVNPLGSNLRNLYMHGLLPQGTREHAAATIHAVGFLASLRLSHDEQRNTGDENGSL